MTAPSVSLGPRTVIASVSNYAEAQELVDTLADRNFPVEHVDLVGSDLHLVEHVTGRLTTARAALGGAISGAWLGLLIGLVFWIVTPWTLAPFLSAILIGLGFGALYGALAHAFFSGKRDFASPERWKPLGTTSWWTRSTAMTRAAPFALQHWAYWARCLVPPLTRPSCTPSARNHFDPTLDSPRTQE